MINPSFLKLSAATGNYPPESINISIMPFAITYAHFFALYFICLLFLICLLSHAPSILSDHYFTPLLFFLSVLSFVQNLTSFFPYLISFNLLNWTTPSSSIPIPHHPPPYPLSLNHFHKNPQPPHYSPNKYHSSLNFNFLLYSLRNNAFHMFHMNNSFIILY